MPSAAARVGATSCCAAGIEYVPALTAGPANMSGIETSYAHGEPCMYITSGSGRVMKSPSRGTMRSWPVRPGKYARANISRKRCRAARATASADATRSVRRPPPPEDRLICCPEIGEAIATRVRARRTAPQAVTLEETTEVRHVVTADVSKRRSAIRRRLWLELSAASIDGLLPKSGTSRPSSPAPRRTRRRNRGRRCPDASCSSSPLPCARYRGGRRPDAVPAASRPEGCCR